jgi:hypothetical protein
MAELERRLQAARPPEAPAAAPPSTAVGPAPSPEDSNPDLPTEPDAGPPAEAAAEAGLPPLEELVARIPAEVRTALDELFRARFTGVIRATPKAVKAAAPK